MKVSKMFCGIGLVVFILAGFSSSYAQKGFVEIRKPFVNVYEFIDPKSNIVTHAKKYDCFELVYEGNSWYQVKVDDKVGWVEKSAGTIINQRGITFHSIPVSTLVFFIFLLLATIGGASFLIYRQKVAEI